MVFRQSVNRVDFLATIGAPSARCSASARWNRPRSMSNRYFQGGLTHKAAAFAT